MNRKKYTAVIIIMLLLLFFSGCIQSQETLNITKPVLVAYNCENGVKIKAEYYSLSDNSLHFIRITLPDGRVFTLPQVISASGARYTDEREIEWWIKGDSAIIKKHTANGDWMEIYHKCAVEK